MSLKFPSPRILKIIRFEPIASGRTNFVLRDGNGKKITEFVISCHQNNLASVASEIKSLLSDIDGITIKIINNKVIIDGEILLPKDMNRIYSVVNQFPDSAASIVTMSPLAQKKIAELIERDIGNPEIHVRPSMKNSFWKGWPAMRVKKKKRKSSPRLMFLTSSSTTPRLPEKSKNAKSTPLSTC